MTLLLIVSLIWAFSFGLIGNVLNPLQPDMVSACRLALAALVFIPFARRLPLGLALRFAAVGAIQFGVMYGAYNWSFQFLKGHQVALLTVTTPFFVTALNDLRQRRFSSRNALLATAAVLGALLVVSHGVQTRASLLGFLLTQLSNLAFAFGQLAYRRLFAEAAAYTPLTDGGVFFYCYAGAALITAPVALLHAEGLAHTVTREQLGVILYLGVVASGLSFYLWNRGARQTSAGTLAVLNNLKIPLAVWVSFLVFGESAHLPRLAVGGGLILAAAAISARLSRSAGGAHG